MCIACGALARCLKIFLAVVHGRCGEVPYYRVEVLAGDVSHRVYVVLMSCGGDANGAAIVIIFTGECFTRVSNAREK